MIDGGVNVDLCLWQGFEDLSNFGSAELDMDEDVEVDEDEDWLIHGFCIRI